MATANPHIFRQGIDQRAVSNDVAFNEHFAEALAALGVIVVGGGAI